MPYRDANASGFIGLCSKTGKPITQGKVGDTPFVWLSVSSAAARAPYDAYGRTATLYAYAPRQGYPPENWLGEQISASSYYSNPAHPMVQAAAEDGALLQQFVQDFPPKWNGLIELRIFLGVLGQPMFNRPYPATDIRVNGDTWTVVRGGNVPCDSGTASSSIPPPPPAIPTGTATALPAGTPSPATGGR